MIKTVNDLSQVSFEGIAQGALGGGWGLDGAVRKRATKRAADTTNQTHRPTTSQT